MIRGRICINTNRHPIHKLISTCLKSNSGSKISWDAKVSKKKERIQHWKTASESIWGNSVFAAQYVWMRRIHKRRFVGACVVVFLFVFACCLNSISSFGYIRLLKHPYKWHSREHYTVANVRAKRLRLGKCQQKAKSIHTDGLNRIWYDPSDTLKVYSSVAWCSTLWLTMHYECI